MKTFMGQTKLWLLKMFVRLLWNEKVQKYLEGDFEPFTLHIYCINMESEFTKNAQQ